MATKSVLPLFIIILLGILFSKTKVASPIWIDVLNKYALWIGFPALIIASLMKLDLTDNSYINLILFNSSYIVFSILLAYPISLVFGLSKKMRSSLVLVLAFGNVAYLGMPVLRNIFGDSVMPVAAIIAATYLFWLFSLGLVLVEVHETKNFKLSSILLNLIKNPLLISVLLSILIIFVNFNMPEVVEQTINLFAQSVTALVLFSLGMFLGFQKIGKLHEWLKIVIFALIIILILPGIYYVFLSNVSFSSTFMKPSIIDAAMPVGITSYVLAEKYKLETTFVARLVVLTTLLAIVILPLWIMITNLA